MKTRNQRFILCLALVVALSIFAINRKFERSPFYTTLVDDVYVVPEECLCKSEKTGNIYNFCYSNPQNSTLQGIVFNCSHVDFMDDFGFFQNHEDTFYENVLKENRNEEDEIFVTACSNDHFLTGFDHYKIFRRSYPKNKVLFYGLDLSNNHQEKLKNEKYLEFRQFNTSKYPSYVKRWLDYRFKPLIIAEVIQEYKNIIWMDAHILIKNANLTNLVHSELANSITNDTIPLKSPILFFIHSSHSNFATLDQRLLDFFPTISLELLKTKGKGDQLGANIIYLSRTKKTFEILKWWILCALEKECMNPGDTTIHCHFDTNRFTKFANCFRYDQSVLNLLLINEYGDYHKYQSKYGYLIN
ncbi:unnamed protein product [Caenorhabditis bovis]|uniref:Uncharacterized protein n=1 Tax=Caenorhabditis bovis TaxID=2654633 RepID=A0A8S1ED11_9PELO|nr:unnamed protein product [Caenorhabditis bovis]